MDEALRILGYVGIVETTVLMIAIGYAIYLWSTGIVPVLYRLGNGLASRRIAIFAKGDNLQSLRALVVESKLFKDKNIIAISQKSDFDRSESASVFLVYWPDWIDEIDLILVKKRESCPLIVYSPADKDRIPPDALRNLDGKRHTAVTNFRGRLLNDIVTAMITTSYEKG